MNRIDLIAVACLALAGAAPFACRAGEVLPSAPDTLFDTIAALDAEVFDAFNRCSAPEQLHRHAAYFDPAVEFYHDTGGVTWTRDAMLANTAQHVCGKFRRELVPGSLRVFPVKDFGAIAQGSHRFCQFESGECAGLADFTIVWRHEHDQWQITRVLSYGHRPNVATKPGAE